MEGRSDENRCPEGSRVIFGRPQRNGEGGYGMESALETASVTDDGERVTPDEPDYCFKAHLSIYNFAKFFTFGKRVLDAGCGTGYGSHYLLENGARSVL